MNLLCMKENFIKMVPKTNNLCYSKRVCKISYNSERNLVKNEL